MQFPINLEGVDPARPQVIKLPLDKYSVVIVDTQYKETQAKTGTRLVFTLRVTKGQYTGVEIPYGINYTNPNPTSQAIGRQELASIFWATIKRSSINDTRELYNIEFMAQIGPGDPVTNNQGEQVTYNEVKGIYLANGQPVTVSTSQAPPTYAPPTAPPAFTPPVAPPYPQGPQQPAYPPSSCSFLHNWIINIGLIITKH